MRTTISPGYGSSALRSRVAAPTQHAFVAMDVVEAVEPTVDGVESGAPLEEVRTSSQRILTLGYLYIAIEDPRR